MDSKATRVPARLMLAGLLLVACHAPTGAAGPPTAADKGAAAETDPPEVSPELRRIAEGYLANRGAFKAFRCEFRYRVGGARDLADALKNGPTVKPLTAVCKWLVDGERICYSRVIDRKARAAQEASKAAPQHTVVGGQPAIIAEIPLSGLGWLTDGKRALRYDPNFVANLMGPNRIAELIEGLSPDTTPWALGGLGRTLGSNPGRWMLDGKLGTWRSVGLEDANGLKLAIIECRRETAMLRYYFDTQRGFLPVRKEYRLNDGRRTHLAVTDTRKCPDGRWFPGRVVSVDMRASGEVWRVQEITVTALDARSKVPSEEMSLVLRRGIQVLHADNTMSAFRLPADERIGIGDLEALHARCDEVLARRLRQRAERNDR
ncbi:MAG TPA: hypothetical protein VM031_00065 [Phycisphaerae bacterium]|nr:hypothetical protein [Phycisphaerae bacterium]